MATRYNKTYTLKIRICMYAYDTPQVWDGMRLCIGRLSLSRTQQEFLERLLQSAPPMPLSQREVVGRETRRLEMTRKAGFGIVHGLPSIGKAHAREIRGLSPLAPQFTRPGPVPQRYGLSAGRTRPRSARGPDRRDRASPVHTGLSA